MNKGTTIILQVDELALEARTSAWDHTAEELIRMFCALMIGQTFQQSTIKDALKEILEDYEDMCDV